MRWATRCFRQGQYNKREAPLRAPFLVSLLNHDGVPRLLLRMNDPKLYRASASQAGWTAFCNLCHHEYGFSPQSDGELAAADRLGRAKGAWEGVWHFFVEALDAYPNLPDLLHRARPTGPAIQLALLEKASQYWPRDNQSAEADLREALLALKDRLPAEARAGYSRATLFRARDLLGSRSVDTHGRHHRSNCWAVAPVTPSRSPRPGP